MRLYLISDKATKGIAQQLLDVSIATVDNAFAYGLMGLKKHLKDPVFIDFLNRQEDLIGRTVDTLIHTQPVEAIAWLERYTRTAQERFGRLRAPHWDAQVIVPLERVYVPARFRFLQTPDEADIRRAEIVSGREAALRRRQMYLSERERQDLDKEFRESEERRGEAELTYAELIVDRTVVLGDPGAGKTTLGSRIAADVLVGRGVMSGAEASPTIPFVVTLRDFASPSTSTSFVEYIERLVTDSFQAKPPPGLIEFLLLTGRALVIFDGLDELLDTSRRRAVVEAVEAFVTSYMNTPILVTARQVGYELAPLDASVFTALQIESFDQADVASYVQSWFLLDDSIASIASRRVVSDRFLSSSETVGDLRTNPLLLALLCNLFKATGYQEMPRSRPAILEKCALVLFDRWDRNRSIGDIDFERDFEPIVAFIAYAMFTDDYFVDGITAPQLIELAVRYLWPRKFATEDDARSFARSLIDHCTGRAWVFADVGTTANGEPIYQFTHRTFMEYYSALYIVRSHRIPERIFTILGPHILAADWGLVPLLTTQILSRRFDEAADDIALELIALASSRDDARPQAKIFLEEMSGNIPLGSTARELIKEFVDAAGTSSAAFALTSKEGGQLVWHDVGGSSLVAATAYDADARQIHVRFHSGECHIYDNCGLNTWQAFMRDTISKGEFVTGVLQRRQIS